MKKVILAVAMIAGVSFTFAQKNTLLVGGNIGYSHDKSEMGSAESKTNVIEFSPTVGYQFSDHWTAGVQSSIGSEKAEVNNTDTVDASNFSLGGFVRYAQPLSNTFAVYGDLGAGYQSTKDKIGDVDGDGIYVDLTPALFINFKNSFGLNFSIGGVRYETLNYDGGSDNSSFDFNFGKTFSIGISKNFGLGSSK